MSKKHYLDKYYTPEDEAQRMIDTTFEVLHEHGYEVSDVIEPAAGAGAFSSYMDCTAYDIKPQAPGIIEADFLQVPLEYMKGRLFIGNPPFGERNNLSIKFYKKCCKYGDYIAFVQPASQYNNNLQMYEFDLIYSEYLGILNYSGRPRRCCFNIYVRPKSGKLNLAKANSLKDITIVDLRRGNDKRKQEIIDNPPDWGICSMGGSSGKKPDYVGQYVRETYFYINKPEIKDKVLSLLQHDKLEEHFKHISMKCMASIGRMIEYLKENIEGLE